jgi:hypothetical protein
MNPSEIAALAERIELIVMSAVTEKAAVPSLLEDLREIADELYDRVDMYISSLAREHFQED